MLSSWSPGRHRAHAMNADSKVPTSAIVWIPPESAWEPIQAVRRKFDRHLSRWMPHVTLLYPFRPREVFDAIEPAVYDACATVPPFELDLRELRFFEHSPSSFTLWLVLQPDEPFRALQAALQSKFPDCDDITRYPTGFTPHLSLGQAHSRQEVDRRLEELRSGWSPVRCPVRELTLIARDGEQPFRVDRIIPLG